MSDDKSQRGQQDRKRINVSEGYELNYWTRQLGCNEEQLRNAVAAVGPGVGEVRQWLSGQHKPAA